MNYRHFSYILIILVFATSCIDEALFNAGDKLTKEVNLPDYSTIEIESTFEIEIISDTVNKVLITCGENLQPFVKISQANDILYLRHEIKNNWSRKYDRVKLEFHTKPFSRINVRNPVKIYTTKVYKAPTFAIVDFMKYSELDIHIDVESCLVAMSSDNFGQFRVKGKARESQFWGWGSCRLQADSLVTEYCNVLHRGIGNVFVNVTKQLDADIQAAGNIYYTGNPSVVNLRQKPGAGNLIKK